MWLATFPDYDASELDKVDQIGWYYIFTASFNIVANVSKLAYEFILDLPKLLRAYDKKFKEFKY